MPWAEQSGDRTWRVRYRTDDNTIGSITGFPDETTAEDYVAQMVAEQRKGTWIDPTAGQITVATWVTEWRDSLDIDQRTEENYNSFLNKHILPRWGTTALADITNIKAQKWARDLRNGGLSVATAASIVKLFSLLLSDAVDEKVIAANPIRARRRGRRRHTPRPPEKVWAEPTEVLHIADQIAMKYGAGGAVLLVTAGWSGARWGELVGLQRRNLHLFDDDTGYFTIDSTFGALHEPNRGPLYLGHLKTDASARIVTLPPCIVRLLRAHLTTHEHPHVFVTPFNDLHRRSNFARRALRQAADGNAHLKNPAVKLRPVKPGLTFHGLRHSHKTWMIDDGIPEIAQALRLGHILEDQVQQTYSHVARAVEQRLLDALELRWEKALASNTTPPEHSAWRLPQAA
ncbi:tyrosine-type recombinase/integrase [Amycolatopsis sp. H20-H5]|uniref:tyrosine-type recombinase/integrase n=1 Tax=Amycolatopsis sp. H20-H5 TaxID=3046309 RepID=UPI002DBA2AA2|nr:tyrosine-type recombinase/integrase [Amycolatopsis sp. H20-H5]MEC3979890.1 tyrosine-type recombinase/integrase [Amycolatopsis sp. H20-H5]